MVWCIDLSVQPCNCLVFPTVVRCWQPPDSVPVVFELEGSYKSGRLETELKAIHSCACHARFFWWITHMHTHARTHIDPLRRHNKRKQLLFSFIIIIIKGTWPVHTYRWSTVKHDRGQKKQNIQLNTADCQFITVTSVVTCSCESFTLTPSSQTNWNAPHLPRQNTKQEKHRHQ